MSLDSAPAGLEDVVFISYTHVDNRPFGPDELRWVSHLHEQLTNRVQQVFGAEVSVWRDEKLQGNDIFGEALIDRLSNVAVLVSVCSPRYVRSEWCRRELDEFVRAAEAGDGVQLGTKSRVFKVLKTPVQLEDLPQALVPVLGYEFYEESPDEHHVREFLLNPNVEERWKFYARVDDLAQDIAALLREIAARRTSPQEELIAGRTVYLAEATSDMAEYRDRVKRELRGRGYRVLPERPLPLAVEELTAAVDGDLARSDLSVHLLGARYGARPEGEERSIQHVQLDLARARARNGLEQLIWAPERLDTVEEEQVALLDRLQADVDDRVELVRASLETFQIYVLNRIAPTPPAPPVASAAPSDAKRVYLVCEPGDLPAAAAVQAELERLGHVVMLPLSKGSETEAREVHEMSMVLCDAVIIYYGDATEHWVRMKLFDLVKSPGWGRSEPFQAKTVLMAPPVTPHKATYETNEALVLDATGGFEPLVLEPFLSQVATGASWP